MLMPMPMPMPMPMLMPMYGVVVVDLSRALDQNRRIEVR